MGVPSEVLYVGTVLLVGYLYNKNDAFKYYAKFLIFLVLNLISATIFIPFMLLRPRNYVNALMPAWGARQTSKILGLKWKVIGHEHIIENSGCVVLINHQSAIDLLVLAELWPIMKRCTVISKKEVFYMWPFGLASWLWGTVFIDRVNGVGAQNTLNETSQTINTKKAKICMFPEGTRHGGDDLLQFKKGAFHIAIDSQAPIQPVVVSKYTFLDSNAPFFKSGESVISILPPIATKGLTKDDITNLIEKTSSIMTKQYHLLNNLKRSS